MAVELLEQRLDRLEHVVDGHEARIARLEQGAAASDVRFEQITKKLDQLESTVKGLVAWTQGTAITVGLAAVSLLLAWIVGR